jgi:3-deoxy-manno-octulosonate cytidylyltransferase (CMP-KDO synthetase)
MKTLTIIPSRLSATRLPGKPLLKINNLSIISHVFKRAQEANIGDVIVAAEDQEIVDDVIKNGGRAILTGKNHKTGTDRIYEAFKKLELKDVDLIMNLQGDEPAINIEDIISLNKKMVSNQSKMGTLAAKIKDLKDLDNENIVKVVTKENLNKIIFRRQIIF